MTLKIKMLAAVATLALPAIAAAHQVGQTQPAPQATPPAEGTQQPEDATAPSNQPVAESANAAARQTEAIVNPAAQQAQGTADETVRPAEESATQPVNSETDVATAPPTPQPQQPTEAAPAEAQGTASTEATTQSEATAQADATVQTQTQTQTAVQAQPAVQPGPVSAATSADLRAGVSVRDTSGGLVGTVETADADSAVVSTGTIRAEIPLRSFGRTNEGLVISLTRAQLEAAARTPTAS